MSHYKEYKTLKYHKKEVTNIIILNDKRLCSCSNDNTVIIYDKNNYIPEIIIIFNNIESFIEFSYHI